MDEITAMLDRPAATATRSSPASPSRIPDRSRHTVVAKENRLLAVLRERPGLTVNEAVDATGEPKGAVLDRLRRLWRRGESVRVGGRWRIAGEGKDMAATAPASPSPSTQPDGYIDGRWVRPISQFIRQASGEFDVSRYG